jgi:hypothetical protein
MIEAADKYEEQAIKRLVVNNSAGDAEPGTPIHEYMLRHRRHVWKCETEQERKEDAAYYLKFNLVGALHKVSEKTANIVECAERNIVIDPCVIPSKEHDVWALNPGTVVLSLFMANILFSIDDLSAFSDNVCAFLESRIPNSYRSGNDILINGKKCCGVDVLYAVSHKTLSVRFGITFAAAEYKWLYDTFDFSTKKYNGITGLKDEAGMDEDDLERFIVDLAAEVRRLCH